MKPVGLAVAPRDVTQVPTSKMVQDRVLLSAVDENYFRVPLEAGRGIVSGGPSVVDAATYAFTFEDLPAGAVTNLRVGELLHALWPKTLVRLNLWYSSPVANVANFTCGIRVRQIGAGSSLAAPTLVTNPTFSVPGPAVANEVLFFTYIAPVALLPALNACGLTFTRIAPDANPNALRFIRADFVLQEVA